ncbi:MAG: hypothetical protein GY928_01130 [Colwellia sp.]|nr:hypothetical protein [Colwellia sp.]
MNDVLRSTTVQLEFQGQDGITGIRQFTRALTDADETVEELSKEMGSNTVVTAKNIKTKKELTADARRFVTQSERTKRKLRELNRLYAHQAAAVNKTADEQEVLNAVYKLGANATQKQQMETAQLVNAYQKVRKETTKTQRGFRNLRGVSQNLGWQLQDVAVQAQMGTSAFTIFAQQGSQMASSFGPAGALVGALIAVGGAMAGVFLKSMFDSEKQAKKLQEGVDELVKSLIKLESFGKNSDLEKLINADIATDKLKEVDKEVKKLTESSELMTRGLVKWDETIALNEKGSEAYKTNLKHQADLEKKLRLNNQLLKESKEKQKALIAVQKGATEETIKNTESVRSMVEALNKEASELGLTKRAIDLKTASLGKANPEQIKAINLAHDAIDAEKMLQEEIAKETQLNATRQKEKDRLIASIIRSFQTESKTLIKQTENIDQQYNRRKKIINDYVMHIGTTNTEIQVAYLNLENWREAQLAKETEKIIREYTRREAIRRQIEKAQTKQLSGDDGGISVENELYLNNVRTLNEQKKSLGEAELDEKIRIDNLIEQETARHESKMNDLNDEALKSSVAVFAMAGQQITSLADMMTNGVAQVENATAEMSAGQKAAFLFSQVVAATMAFINGVSLGGKLAEIFPLQAPTMLTIGATIGAANAGAIMGATIAGTFDKGGSIPSGQLGIVSEYGDELVNGQLVKGPARVTSREDTAKMMGNSNVKITIENKIEGARFREERVDIDTVKIVAEQVFSKNIDNGVSGVLGNRNSKATKALKRKFNVRSQY